MPLFSSYIRSPLCFSPAELRSLSYEMDHPVDEISHASNLKLRRDFLLERRRRLRIALAMVHPGANPDDEEARHTRLSKECRDMDAAIASVNAALVNLSTH
jgi:hypothetical protein